MDNQLLLLEDVEHVGRKGDLVKVKPGFSRNYLFPKSLAVVAGKHTIKMRERLQEERNKQALIDKSDAEKISAVLKDKVFSVDVKVDHEGHMYGSVSVADILTLLTDAGFTLTKKNIVLKQPIKRVGEYTIHLKLKEDVPARVQLHIKPEGGFIPQKVEVVSDEENAQEQSEEG